MAPTTAAATSSAVSCAREKGEVMNWTGALGISSSNFTRTWREIRGVGSACHACPGRVLGGGTGSKCNRAADDQANGGQIAGQLVAPIGLPGDGAGCRQVVVDPSSPHTGHHWGIRCQNFAEGALHLPPTLPASVACSMPLADSLYSALIPFCGAGHTAVTLLSACACVRVRVCAACSPCHLATLRPEAMQPATHARTSIVEQIRSFSLAKLRPCLRKKNVLASGAIFRGRGS